MDTYPVRVLTRRITVADGGPFDIIKVVLSPALVAANTTAEQSFTVNGVGANDTCMGCSKPTAQAGIGICGARVTALNTVGVTFNNNTAGGITPTAGETYSFVVFRPTR
jgi:hypothetical protein